MLFDIFYVNAFIRNNQLFSGNPAAVCQLDEFLPDNLLQQIAAQNNLSETAFIVLKGQQCFIRWFAPKQEVELCGHATLAAAHVIFHTISPNITKITFSSAKHQLQASLKNDLIALDFPARSHEEIATPSLITQAISYQPLTTLAADDYIVVLNKQAEIEKLTVDLNKLAQLDRRGVVFTAQGVESDFVSRVFHPKLGIAEDPVCGSAHCELVPYWSAKLNKTSLSALQLSERGGELYCELKEDRVLLKGKCMTYLSGRYQL